MPLKIITTARRSVQTLVDRFVRSGGQYRHELAHTPQQASGPVRSLRLASGGTLEADAFVFALGPWLAKHFPDVIGRRILPTRQEEFYFAAPAGDRRFLPGAMPGWADFNGGDIFYGFPDLESRGVEVSEVQDFPWGRFVFFADPDGNRWAVQEIQRPG